MVTHCMVCLMVGNNWDLKLQNFQGEPDLMKSNISENRKKIISEIHKLHILISVLHCKA